MNLEMVKVGKDKLRIDIWFANRKQLACLRTTMGHLKNMFKGVTYVSIKFCVFPVTLVVRFCDNQRRYLDDT